jgi:hypothetical protein
MALESVVDVRVKAFCQAQYQALTESSNDCMRNLHHTWWLFAIAIGVIGLVTMTTVFWRTGSTSDSIALLPRPIQIAEERRGANWRVLHLQASPEVFMQLFAERNARPMRAEKLDAIATAILRQAWTNSYKPKIVFSPHNGEMSWQALEIVAQQENTVVYLLVSPRQTDVLYIISRL